MNETRAATETELVEQARGSVAGAIARGASARWFGRDTRSDNPYPDMPGCFVMRRAWDYGFMHAEEVIAAEDQPDVPPEERMPVQLPELPKRAQWPVR